MNHLNLNEANLAATYLAVRRFTNLLAAPLSAEDCMVQSMADASPTRWHLAHTTWFFETFLLREDPTYRLFDKSFNILFNSYYNSVGEPFPRSRRGLISRPGLKTILDYREFVDEQIVSRLEATEFARKSQEILLIGLNHEQQHQELILTDIKHVLSSNPNRPQYEAHPIGDTDQARSDNADRWIKVEANLYEAGYQGSGFAFDNESPKHRVFIDDCSVSRRLVSCGEYLEFIGDGGYSRPEFWLSLGWNAVQQRKWTSPLYWTEEDGNWMQFSMAGLVPFDPDWPVCHLSYFEADAFARWSGKRLPTEFEWEVAALTIAQESFPNEQFVDRLIHQGVAIHPTRSSASLIGGVWQWTSSSYSAYPGYRQPAGAIGEYNGKFMCNQYVLRGGSVATHSTHIRPTYRNFFPADTRWQFAGLRLAKDH